MIIPIYGQDFAYDRDTEDFGNIIKVADNHVYVGLSKQTVSALIIMWIEVKDCRI